MMEQKWSLFSLGAWVEQGLEGSFAWVRSAKKAHGRGRDSW